VKKAGVVKGGVLEGFPEHLEHSCRGLVNTENISQLLEFIIFLFEEFKVCIKLEVFLQMDTLIFIFGKNRNTFDSLLAHFIRAEG
jgi:hypothetical protein